MKKMLNEEQAKPCDFRRSWFQPDQFELPAEKVSSYRISALELKMAEQLIDSMTVDWKPVDYRDDFRDKLHEFIQRRIARSGASGRQEPSPRHPHPKGRPMSLTSWRC